MSTQSIPSAPLVGHPVEMTGEVRNITWANKENGFAIVRLTADKQFANWPVVKGNGTVTLVGPLASARVGERMEVTGTVTEHKEFGLQITVSKFRLREPINTTAIRKYLEKHAYGVDKVLSNRIVDAFGEDTIKVIDNTPERLREVPGIGAKKYAEIIKAWNEQKSERDWMRFATEIGVGSGVARKMRDIYGEAAESAVRADPYNLARDVDGIGFKTADEIATRLGVHELSPLRLIACIEHQLRERSSDGDCFMYRIELVQKVAEMLSGSPHVTAALIEQMLAEAIVKGMVVEETNGPSPRIYLKQLHVAEVESAAMLAALMKAPMPPELQGAKLEKARQAAITSFPYSPAEQQRQAILTSLSKKVSVITGGPGTGKTTITQAVVQGFLSVGLPVKLLAPTGRAAKRMAEVIGLPGSTIHLDLHEKSKAFREGAELHTLQIRGVVLVDETSMVDVKMMRWLLQFIHPSAVLVIIGDKDQLPSVGPGAVLRDLLDSNIVPVTMLNQIFRQSNKSRIAVAAADVNGGMMPELFMFGGGRPMPTDSDIVTSFLDDESQIANQAVWAATMYAKSLGMDPVKDCIVLSPQHGGVAGVSNLNSVLQRQLNPNPTKIIERGMGTVWAVGDRVMQTKNNYRLGVCNGEMGQIVDLDIDQENGNLNGVTVSYDGIGDRYYEETDYCDLKLSYACTIHKMQGSEFPMVVLVLHTRHYTMLQRNLIYTGMTRGKKHVVLIAHPRALDMAISNNKVAKRNTLLADRLISAVKEAA